MHKYMAINRGTKGLQVLQTRRDVARQYESVYVHAPCMQSWSSIAERDVRAAVLLLLAARCKGSLEDTAAVGGSSFFFDVLEDADPRVRHTAASFLQVCQLLNSSFHWLLCYRNMFISFMMDDHPS